MEKNPNYDLYFEKLKGAGVPEDACEKLKETYGKDLLMGSFATMNDTAMAYDGSIIDVALKKLAVYAYKINNLFPEDVRVEPKSLIKVCLLQHISKAIRTEKCPETWRINRGELYSYTRLQPAIGTGLHSVAMASECGIPFNAFEIEAMTSIDRAPDDAQSKYYSNVLSSIVKMANEMVYVEAKKEHELIV